MTGQDTDVYFFGETIEKIGPKKYKITNGGFTTCVQPTPRWDLHADTVVLNVDHYTLLRNAVLQREGRADVLPADPLLPDQATTTAPPASCSRPTASSTLRGQSIHNAFFWAINRSQDATFLHDWYSKTGQGVGSEYRYNFGGGTTATSTAYLLDQHEATYTPTTDGATLPAQPQLRDPRRRQPGAAAATFARGRNVDYFSSIATTQTFNTNIYDASRNSRTLRRQRRRRVEQLLAERHVRSQRVLLRATTQLERLRAAGRA